MRLLDHLILCQIVVALTTLYTVHVCSVTCSSPQARWRWSAFNLHLHYPNLVSSRRATSLENIWWKLFDIMIGGLFPELLDNYVIHKCRKYNKKIQLLEGKGNEETVGSEKDIFSLITCNLRQLPYGMGESDWVTSCNHSLPQQELW